MHIPVLQKEVLQYLNPEPNENFIDCTIGEGGHTLTILEKTGPRGKVLGIDRDPEIDLCLRLDLKHPRLVLVCDNFANLKEIVEKTNFSKVNPHTKRQYGAGGSNKVGSRYGVGVKGILFDLGMSSWHLEESGRGFSFQKKEPLDMRYNPQNQLTAEKIINFWSKFELERILKEYGEERFSKEAAEEIIEARRIKPIENTLQLVEIIREAVPAWYRKRKLHFATKTFQALRIAVNDELNNLKKALPQSLTILKPGGSLVVISFHSLEDRIVKNFLKNQAKEGSLKIITKKPISPSSAEIKINPRSRSAKLRAAQKT